MGVDQRMYGTLSPPLNRSGGLSITQHDKLLLNGHGPMAKEGRMNPMLLWENREIRHIQYAFLFSTPTDFAFSRKDLFQEQLCKLASILSIEKKMAKSEAERTRGRHGY
jgi:hypothetical protein